MYESLIMPPALFASRHPTRHSLKAFLVHLKWNFKITSSRVVVAREMENMDGVVKRSEVCCALTLADGGFVVCCLITHIATFSNKALH